MGGGQLATLHSVLNPPQVWLEGSSFTYATPQTRVDLHALTIAASHARGGRVYE